MQYPKLEKYNLPVHHLPKDYTGASITFMEWLKRCTPIWQNSNGICKSTNADYKYEPYAKRDTI